MQILISEKQAMLNQIVMLAYSSLNPIKHNHAISDYQTNQKPSTNLSQFSSDHLTADHESVLIHSCTIHVLSYANNHKHIISKHVSCKQTRVEVKS